MNASVCFGALFLVELAKFGIGAYFKRSES